MGAYPSARRRFPRQLVSLEELLLRGRITSRSVGMALLTGIAAGGWIAVVPHLIRATGCSEPTASTTRSTIRFSFPARCRWSSTPPSS